MHLLHRGHIQTLLLCVAWCRSLASFMAACRALNTGLISGWPLGFMGSGWLSRECSSGATGLGGTATTVLWYSRGRGVDLHASNCPDRLPGWRACCLAKVNAVCSAANGDNGVSRGPTLAPPSAGTSCCCTGWRVSLDDRSGSV